jgi:DNA polymerase-1
MAIETWNDKSRRQDAKRATLSAIYEVGYDAFVKKYDVSYDQAKQVLDDFRAKFPGIKKESKGWEAFSAREGYVPLISGRRRWFEPLQDTYMAFNQRVQGGLAEIMAPIMLQIEAALPGRMVLQIHDSVILRLPTDIGAREPMLSAMAEIIRDSVPGWLRDRTEPRIPMLADFKNWQG